MLGHRHQLAVVTAAIVLAVVVKLLQLAVLEGGLPLQLAVLAPVFAQLHP
jgi:hypothetical protein